MKYEHYKLPEDLAADIDAYEQEVNRHLAGEIPAAVFKAWRVPRGVYEQRQDQTFMVRVRVAGGTLSCAQTRELAALSHQYGNGLLHVTTRQDIQFHDIAIGDTPTIMRRLMTVGLTSKGGGGNTVRNVTACPYAGICSAERFDVTPFAHAVTEYLIGLTGSYNLPRKYKIAFSGCGCDCALAQVADLGFIAETREGRPGFRVLAGGGMGAHSRIADTLLEWSPASDIVRVAETVRRLFDRLGDRSDRHRARLRFVFDRIGPEEFVRHYSENFAATVRDGVPEWRHDLAVNRDCLPGNTEIPPLESHSGLRVIRQRQNDYWAVPLHAPLGFLPATDLIRIGELAESFSGEEGVRTVISQNLMLRFVKKRNLPALVKELQELEMNVISPVPLDRFVACAGASTCRLGICLARNSAHSCAMALSKAKTSRETLDTMRFYINGCPNACGHQPIGPVGFYGGAQRSDDGLVPSYTVTLGGRCDGRGARFGEPAGKVPVAALPAFVQDLASDFEDGRLPGEEFSEYFDRLGSHHFEAIVNRHESIPPRDMHPEFYRDIGATENFSLAGRGAGECGAGVFEVINEDLALARKAVSPFDILLPVVRALLITRGIDTRDPDKVFRAFERHIIDTGLADEKFRPLISLARGYIQGWKTALDGRENEILRLREQIELLYSTLDANLEFHPPTAPSDENKSIDSVHGYERSESNTEKTAFELDLSGVACPMNFVQAKLKLETMNDGDLLAVILDDGDPVENVPASFRNEGREVVDVTQIQTGQWRVLIRK